MDTAAITANRDRGSRSHSGRPTKMTEGCSIAIELSLCYIDRILMEDIYETEVLKMIFMVL
jgi:hypothetical protein